MSQISFLVAFTAGVLSFFSPCVLPLVPAYLANLAGSTAINNRIGYRPTLFHSLSFVAGFSLVFIMLGVLAGLFGSAISINPGLLQKIAGSILIVFGVFLIAAFKIPWLNYEKRLKPMWGSHPGYLRSLFIGAVFGLGWTPCVGPVLGTILTLAWSSQTVGQGAALLFIYSLGLGIPFIFIGLLWGIIAPLWKSLNRYLWVVSIASGLLLIIVGVLIITGNFAQLSQLS